VPLSPTGAELLFEVFSQRYERGSTIVTSNLPFDEWTGTFGSERLTGALLGSAVTAMFLGHGVLFNRTTTLSILSTQTVQSQGRTPIGGQHSMPIDNQAIDRSVIR
jgi:IstB-like ATP binding protein